MRPDMVVMLDPLPNDNPDFFEADKDLTIKKVIKINSIGAILRIRSVKPTIKQQISIRIEYT